jgi:hypothetical protein
MFACKIPFRLMYHFVNGLFSHVVTRDVHPDDADGRIVEMIRWRSISVIYVLLALYLRLIVVDTKEEVLPLCGQSFATGDCFLVHWVDRIFVWVNGAVAIEFLKNLFGVD